MKTAQSCRLAFACSGLYNSHICLDHFGITGMRFIASQFGFCIWESVCISAALMLSGLSVKISCLHFGPGLKHLCNYVRYQHVLLQ
jgi:hypothetical protein